MSDSSLGAGTISAIIKDDRRPCSAKLLFNTAVTGQTRMSSYSFNNQLGTPSGSGAFLGLSLSKADKTARSEKGQRWQSLLCDGKDSSLERTLLVVGMQSWFGWQSPVQTEEWNPRSLSWQTRSLSQEREPCQWSTLHQWLGLVCLRWFTLEA